MYIKTTESYVLVNLPPAVPIYGVNYSVLHRGHAELLVLQVLV